MKNGTWKLLPRKEMTKGRKPLKTRNVYKYKVDNVSKEEVFHVRNVVKGFAQLPGIDYKESFAPVVSNTTERITSAIYLWQLEKLAKEIHPTVRNKTTLKTVQQKWVRKMLDVVAAFLMGLLEEDIYIELPIYFKEFMAEIGEPVNGDVVVKLERSQYGLVQAARV